MRKLHTRKGGFTLIELMIVVAIIGILAAIAIPNFLRFQLRSKTGEAKTNLAAIRTAEEGFFAEFGSYVAAATTPAGSLGSQKRPWTGGGITSFDQMGWGPEGQVYFNYAAVTAGTGTSWAAGAQGNLDGDSVTSDFGYVHPLPGASVGPDPMGACTGTGVYAPGTTLLNTVGICTANDGQSEF
jgi:type IV pilus assembly protein PilA